MPVEEFLAPSHVPKSNCSICHPHREIAAIAAENPSDWTRRSFDLKVTRPGADIPNVSSPRMRRYFQTRETCASATRHGCARTKVNRACYLQVQRQEPAAVGAEFAQCLHPLRMKMGQAHIRENYAAAPLFRSPARTRFGSNQSAAGSSDMPTDKLARVEALNCSGRPSWDRRRRCRCKQSWRRLVRSP